MTDEIGPRGHKRLVFAEAGPQRAVRVLAFTGRNDTGFCPVPHLRTGEPPLAVIDVTKGRLVTSSFSGTVTGGISQSDTGGLGNDGQMGGHVMCAIVTDTGTAGL